MNKTNKLIEKIADELVEDVSTKEVEKKVISISPEFYALVEESNLLKRIQANLEDCTTDIATMICGEPSYSSCVLETDFIHWKNVMLFRTTPIFDKWQKITELYVEKTKGPE